MKRLWFVLVAVSGITAAQAANWPDRPVLRAVRATVAPVLDGNLSDAAWQNAPEFDDFTQHDPEDGKPATQKTRVRVVYDDDAIYFGIRCEDTHPPTTQLGRRDNFLTADFLSINIDSQHDRLSGNAFTLYPSNVQMDTVLYDDVGEDNSWDGVWTSATSTSSEGWIAEVRVPFSQLRFPDKPSHTWGLNITRRTLRTNEIARIVNVPKGQTGFVSRFADLTGIEGIHRGRPLEMVPYGVARSDLRTGIDGDRPFAHRSALRSDAGLDLKYALTSSLTLTGTINPDFGQVEVDPAVVNLTEFETFYPEKRPFFTEGSSIFRFGQTPATAHFNFFFPPSFFYSRRIGRSPQGGVDADFSVSPTETTIIGAAKVTGKIGKSLSIGVLDAVTDAERALFVDGTRSGRQQVEPMTNYFVGRATWEIGSDARIGGMVTSVTRRLSDELSFLRDKSFAAAFDGYTFFGKRAWIAEWEAGGTHVGGSQQAIALTQTAAARYYQRPDADYLTFDPSRTSIDGYGGRVMVSKQTGVWRPNMQVRAYSPGFESNDAGFMNRTDMISSHALMMYVNENPGTRLRDRVGWAGVYHNANFGGDMINAGAFVDGRVTFVNYWGASGAIFLSPAISDDRKTRGGPLVRRPASFSTNASLDTDDRKRVWFYVGISADGVDDGSYARSLSVSVQYRPSPSLTLKVMPYYSRSHEFTQYVTTLDDSTATATFGRRYVFAELEQRTFELGTRADWTLNPRLSLQLYVQPFIAAGDYHDFRSLVRPGTDEYERFTGPVGEPDFNFRSVRGSAVMRWEFRPGSALYVVWNENRSEVEPVGDFRFGRDLRGVASAPSHDVFLVKLSYWIPL